MIWIIVWVNFSIHHIPIPRHTLESGPGPGSSEKVNPGTLEKAGGSKFTIMVKNSFLINFRVLILNATTAFFKFWPKSTQVMHFWSKTYKKVLEICKICRKKCNFFFLAQNFAFWQNSRVLISNMTIVIFSNSSPKLPKVTIWVRNLIFFI